MKIRDLLLVLLSVLLLSLARLPVKLGLLVFIGWIPLIWVMKEGGKSVWRLLLYGAIWSVTYCGIVYYWIFQVTWGGLIGIMLLFTLYLWLVFYAMQRIWSRFPKLGGLGFILLMLSFEYLQNFGETRFPWWNSGYALADYLVLIQAADLGGMTLLSLLILSVNLCIERVLAKRWRALIGLGLIFALWISYGVWCLKILKPQQRDLHVQVMQPSIPQEDKWDQAHYIPTVERFAMLTQKAAQEKAQLIVWPEGAMPVYLRYDLQGQKDLRWIVNSNQIEVFTGFPNYLPAPPDHFDEAYFYNAASLFKPFSPWEPIFHKNILVPVGERMLWLKTFPFLAKLQFGQANWEFGTELVYYESHGYHFSPSICYELAFPDINHRMALPKDKKTGTIKKMDFLVNVTNDAWFGTSYGPWLHQVMTRFRAVENRIQIYRSANTGISVIVDPLGRELASAGLFEIKNIKAPLYTHPRIPLIRYIYHYPMLLVLVALALFGASLFKPPAKEASR